MQQMRGSGLQSVSSGFIILAVAVAILIAWVLGNWWMFFPVLFLELGAFYTAIGFSLFSRTGPSERGGSSGSYYVFWGPTLAILGIIWILRAETDISGVLILVIFLLWIGGVAMALSLRKRKPGTGL